MHNHSDEFHDSESSFLPTRRADVVIPEVRENNDEKRTGIDDDPDTDHIQKGKHVGNSKERIAPRRIELRDTHPDYVHAPTGPAKFSRDFRVYLA